MLIPFFCLFLLNLLQNCHSGLLIKHQAQLFLYSTEATASEGVIYNYDSRQYNKIMALIGHDYEIFLKTLHEGGAWVQTRG